MKNAWICLKKYEGYFLIWTAPLVDSMPRSITGMA